MELFKKLANFIYVWLEGLDIKSSVVLSGGRVREDLMLLEPAADVSKKHKQFMVEKLALCLLIVVIGVLMSGLLWIKSSKDSVIEDNKLIRNAYGEGSQEIELIADTGRDKVPIGITINERQLTYDEQEKIYDEFYATLRKTILGENESFEKIEYDLELVKELEGFPFTIEWTTDEEYVSSEGELLIDKLSDPVQVELMVSISGSEYEKNETLICNIHSRKIPHTTEYLLTKYLTQIEENSLYEDYVVLPEIYEELRISWKRDQGHNAIICLILTPIVAIAIYIGKDKDLHGLVEKREEQMKRDYPEIVSKLSLYIGAGMTVSNAWSKVAIDYQNKKKQTGNMRYAYEEMLITMREIESGVTLYDAYDRFGKRCRVPCYTKAATLLAQNIRKGSSNIAQILQEESNEAFEERKHSARKLGEKASTKLLVPMMLLLLMIMIIILVPAFMNQFI